MAGRAEPRPPTVSTAAPLVVAAGAATMAVAVAAVMAAEPMAVFTAPPAGAAGAARRSLSQARRTCTVAKAGIRPSVTERPCLSGSDSLIAAQGAVVSLAPKQIEATLRH